MWAQKGGRGKNQQSEKQDAESDRIWLKMKLHCWMVPDSEADEMLTCEGALQTSSFPGDAAARLPAERAVVTETRALSAPAV